MQDADSLLPLSSAILNTRENSAKQTAKCGNILWVADENSDALQLNQHLKTIQNSFDTVHLITNRIDTNLALDPPIKSTFSDFDFTAISNNTFSAIAYRVSKEKNVVNHILNEASRMLQPAGILVLFGKKQEGIKSIFDNARKILGFSGTLKKMGDNYLATLTKPLDEPKQKLGASDYYSEISFEHRDILFQSKPGLFGWQKIDAGSALLAEQLQQHIQTTNPLPEGSTLLDLGCGFGYLSVMAAAYLTPSKITATDNNAAALAMCAKNLAKNCPTLPANVIADDCASTIQGTFDIIVCNPPFHQGFKNDYSLTEKFIARAKRLSHKKTKAFFVFNAFLPAEKIAKVHFKSVSTLANNKQFKVLLFSNA